MDCRGALDRWESARSGLGILLQNVCTREREHEKRPRDGFPAPDQVAAARARAAPPPDGIIRRFPIRSCVPTLHWLHRESVAILNGPVFSDQRTGDWDPVTISGSQGIRRWRSASGPENSNIFQTSDATDCSSTLDAVRRSGKPKTANPPSNARLTSTKQLKE